MEFATAFRLRNSKVQNEVKTSLNKMTRNDIQLKKIEIILCCQPFKNVPTHNKKTQFTENLSF
jgi:hypothetical protein